MNRWLSFVLILSISLLFGADKVAMAVKVKGDVKVYKVDTADGISLKPGTPIHDQDKIVSNGKKSSAMIMFLDDKSILKIRENSQFVVGGKKSPEGISKNINLGYGKMTVNVSPQKGKQFVVSTPTSVASVKGTEFFISSDPTDGDQFILFSGLLEVENGVSGQIINMTEGETANSSPDGDLESHETTEEEMEESEEEDSGQVNELRFQFEDESGNTKEVIIQFSE